MSAFASVSRTYEFEDGYKVTFAASGATDSCVRVVSAEWSPCVPDAVAMLRLRLAYRRELAAFAAELQSAFAAGRQSGVLLK
jgi:hypothetical protein